MGATNKRNEYHAIFNRDKRIHLTQTLARKFAGWSKSPFELEADYRNGIRSALCLKGYDWERSNHEAQAVVEDALNLIGARRPSWNEAQPRNVDSIDYVNCLQCDRSMQDDFHELRLGPRYCSKECAHAAFESRNFSRRDTSNRAYAHAYRAVARLRENSKACEICNREFKPRKDAKKQKYCSYKCLAHARVKMYEREERCQICYGVFVARHVSTLYCGKPCSALATKIRSGWIPVKFSPVAFDHFILCKREGV